MHLEAKLCIFKEEVSQMAKYLRTNTSKEEVILFFSLNFFLNFAIKQRGFHRFEGANNETT